MKTTKKVLSVLLSLIIVLGAISVGGVSVSAQGDYLTADGFANQWGRSDLRAWLNGLTKVNDNLPADGSNGVKGSGNSKNFLDSFTNAELALFQPKTVITNVFNDSAVLDSEDDDKALTRTTSVVETKDRFWAASGLLMRNHPNAYEDQLISADPGYDLADFYTYRQKVTNGKANNWANIIPIPFWSGSGVDYDGMYLRSASYENTEDVLGSDSGYNVESHPLDDSWASACACGTIALPSDTFVAMAVPGETANGIFIKNEIDSYEKLGKMNRSGSVPTWGMYLKTITLDELNGMLTYNSEEHTLTFASAQTLPLNKCLMAQVYKNWDWDKETDDDGARAETQNARVGDTVFTAGKEILSGDVTSVTFSFTGNDTPDLSGYTVKVWLEDRATNNSLAQTSNPLTFSVDANEAATPITETKSRNPRVFAYKSDLACSWGVYNDEDECTFIIHDEEEFNNSIHYEGTGATYQKLYIGTDSNGNPIEWWIAGRDGNTLTLYQCSGTENCMFNADTSVYEGTAENPSLYLKSDFTSDDIEDFIPKVILSKVAVEQDDPSDCDGEFSYTGGSSGSTDDDGNILDVPAEKLSLQFCKTDSSEWSDSPDAVGTYYVRAAFAGGTIDGVEYAPCFSNVRKINYQLHPLIILSVPEETQVEGEELTIIVGLPEDATGTVTLAIGDEEGTAAVSGDGTAEIKIAATPGEHEVLVSYSGDDNYNAVTEELTVKIPKYSFTVTLEISLEEPVYGDDVTITANLPDGATGNITLTVDGIDYTVPVKDGKAVFTVESPDPGEHTVTASYPGDDNYNEASASGTFTVQAAVIAPTGISLDNHEINFTEGSSQVIAAVIEPAGATGTVVWSSSNESAATVTDNNNGTATVTAAGVGMAVITAAIQGTDFSDSCTVSVTEYICPHTNKTEIPAKAATCTEPGNNRYYKCDDCGKYLKADGTTVTTPSAESIPAPGHSYPSFYESNDTQHWQVCSRCYEDSAKDNHTFGEATYTWSADNSTCTASHACSVCGREVRETVDSTPQETPATCFADGKIQYTATFTKPGFTSQTTEAPSGESAGHDWGATAYVWSGDNSTCTATRVCTRNADHKEEETVNAAVTTTATCTEAGVTTYTARFENSAFEVQKKLEATDALGHNREESIAKEATEDSLGIIEDRCTRCGDTDNTRLYLLDNTSPSKYPDGSYISEDVVSSADNGTLGSDGIQMVLQDPLGAFDDYFITYSAELIGVSADMGADYDNAFETENACRALVGVTIDVTYIVGTFPEKARLLLQIPDGWDVDDIAALRINSGDDTYYVTAVEYRLYDAEGEFVKVVTADYEPAEGETVRAFAAFWTDYFYNSPYAIVDIYTDKDALDEYKDEAKNAIDALAQDGDSDEVREIIDSAKDAVDALGYDENKSRDENKAAVDALVDSAAGDVEDQREADKLAADKEAFDEYKDEAKNTIDALAQNGDSDEVKSIIDNAKDAVDALGYDESKSLEENKAAVDALVDSAAYDVEEQREAEQTPASVEIKDFTEETETDYKEDKTFTASAENLPEGAEIHWFVNGEDVGTGESYTVEDPTEDYNIYAAAVDADGNILDETQVQAVKVRNGFMDKLKWFFSDFWNNIFKAVINAIIKAC